MLRLQLASAALACVAKSALGVSKRPVPAQPASTHSAQQPRPLERGAAHVTQHSARSLALVPRKSAQPGFSTIKNFFYCTSKKVIDFFSMGKWTAHCIGSCNGLGLPHAKSEHERGKGES